jgi:hypothetical protein
MGNQFGKLGLDLGPHLYCDKKYRYERFNVERHMDPHVYYEEIKSLEFVLF